MYFDTECQNICSRCEITTFKVDAYLYKYRTPVLKLKFTIYYYVRFRKDRDIIFMLFWRVRGGHTAIDVAYSVR